MKKTSTKRLLLKHVQKEMQDQHAVSMLVMADIRASINRLATAIDGLTKRIETMDERVDRAGLNAVYAREASMRCEADLTKAASRLNSLRNVLCPDFLPVVGEVAVVKVQHLKRYPPGSMFRIARVDRSGHVEDSDGHTFKAVNLRKATEFEVAEFNLANPPTP